MHMYAVERRTWEYLTERTSSPSSLQDMLSVRGQEGWELVNVLHSASAAEAAAPAKTLRMRHDAVWWVFFKRPCEPR